MAARQSHELKVWVQILVPSILSIPHIVTLFKVKYIYYLSNYKYSIEYKIFITFIIYCSASGAYRSALSTAYFIGYQGTTV